MNAAANLCGKGPHRWFRFEGPSQCTKCSVHLRYSCRNPDNCRNGHRSHSPNACAAETCSASVHDWNSGVCGHCGERYEELHPECAASGEKEHVKNRSPSDPCPDCGLYDPFAGL